MAKLIERPSWARALTALEELYYYLPDCAEAKPLLKRIERIIEKRMPSVYSGNPVEKVLIK